MKKQQLVFLVMFVAAGLICASPASAERALGSGGGGFGAPGEVVITGELEGHLRNGWELRLHPALDYFIASNISVGGLVGITYDSGNPSVTTFDLGARAGFNLGINDAVTFWPTAGIVFHHTAVGSTAAASGTSSSSTSFEIFAPFLFHLVPHLFVGAGPIFDLELSGGNGNGYGLQTLVGGWF
jgi:hypothetical protein